MYKLYIKKLLTNRLSHDIMYTLDMRKVSLYMEVYVMTENRNPTLSTLKILYILSGITIFSALFVPVFYIDLEIVSEAQWSVQYFISLVTKRSMDLDLLSDFHLDKLLKGIYGVFDFLFIVIGCVSIFDDMLLGSGPLAELSKSKGEDAVQGVFSGIRFRFILLTVHFLYSFAICFFIINEKAFSPVSTFSFIPAVIAFVLFGFASFKRKEYLNEIQIEKEQKENAVYILCQQIKLLEKYKVMYIHKILTDEEFNQKKEEITASILNVKLTAMNATEEQKVYILKNLHDMQNSSLITSEQFDKIKTWLCEI